ncbi:hypothetical protein EI164_15105 [Psychrobacter sp. FME13]|uniref:hypothetical protein n=1 Tax=unclassified Psychrobacter TaxID=196806 RepID=UPI001787ABEB|nr:hypothetical protein [Psychrobacter sp. FME13]MBE0443360.1 hypothetical protein [Psychrobacter sp. FME13]
MANANEEYINNNEEYLDNLVKRFRGFKSPNDTQKLIVLLGEKDNRNDEDNRKLSILLKAEKKADQLVKARANARKLIDAEKSKASKAEVRRKIIWQSAFEAMAEDSMAAKRNLDQLKADAYNKGYVSDRDKDAVKNDLIKQSVDTDNIEELDF